MLKHCQFNWQRGMEEKETVLVYSPEPEMIDTYRVTLIPYKDINIDGHSDVRGFNTVARRGDVIDLEYHQQVGPLIAMVRG